MKVKLKDAFDLQIGRTPARSNAANWNGQYKWISITDLGNAGKYISTTKEKITDKGIDESGIKIVPKGTVVMSFKLSIGKTAITTEDMYTNEAIIAFNVRESIQVDSSYLYYLCCGTDWVEGTNKAVMGLTLNKATLSEKEIELPEIMIQREVAKKLDKLDKIIVQRKKQLQKLDELIQARFVEMFGDPISNSLESNMLPMTDVCEIIDGDRGKNYPTQEEFNEKGYCLFLNAKNVTNVGFDFDKCMFITKQKDEILRKGKLCRGDVVLTTRGTIGNMAYYTEKIPFEHIRINSGMVILRMKHEIINEVFFIEQFKMQIANIKSKIASGSAQPQLPISTMNRIHILIPDINSQNQFADFVNQVNKSKLVIKNLLQIYKHQIQM